MAGAVDVVSHTEIERGRNGNTALHSSYSTTSVTLCSWGGGGCCICPVSLWQAVTAAQRWIYKVASYSISRSCYYIENCLCHKQLMDEGGVACEPRLPLLFYLLCDLYFVEWLMLYFQWQTAAL